MEVKNTFKIQCDELEHTFSLTFSNNAHSLFQIHFQMFDSLEKGKEHLGYCEYLFQPIAGLDR